MRISDWSSDVCSSDLTCAQSRGHRVPHQLSVASVDNGWPHGSKGIAVWRATLERVAAFEFGQPDGAIENGLPQYQRCRITIPTQPVPSRQSATAPSQQRYPQNSGAASQCFRSEEHKYQLQ